MSPLLFSPLVFSSLYSSCHILSCTSLHSSWGNFPRRAKKARAQASIAGGKMIIMNYLVYSGIRLKKSKSISLSLCWTSQSLISTVSKRHIEKRPLNFIRTGTMEMSRQLRNYLQRFSLHIRSFLTRRSEHGIIRIGKFSWGARPRQGAIISITHGWQRQTIS